MINIVDNIKSTNTWLTEFGLDTYDSMISLKQSEGYGRLGRFWESDLGGLYFSVNLPNRNLLPIIIGISVADILVKLKLNVKLKWPNDILLNDMKLGGVICHSEDKMRDVAGSHFREAIVNGQFFEFADKDMQEYVFQHVANIIET